MRFSSHRLRCELDRSGLNPEQLAVSTGLTYSTIAKLLSGAIRPSLSSLGRLTDALGCDVGAFFDGEPDLAAADDPRASDLGADVDAWVASVVAAMPPLTPEQARRVSASLFRNAQPTAPPRRRRRAS